jgi:hypothetical protein
MALAWGAFMRGVSPRDTFIVGLVVTGIARAALGPMRAAASIESRAGGQHGSVAGD